MRNKLIKLTALVGVAGILLMGCGGKGGNTSVDVNALTTSLTQDITYSEPLQELAAEDIENYVLLEEGVEAVMYMSSGSTAEEVAVFTAPDETTANTMKENVTMFLDDQRASFKDYIPEEASRIDNAVLVVNGNYVVLCVSGDSEAAQDIIDKAFNN